MTDEEKRLALALDQCTFVPGIGTKRFAKDMAGIARGWAPYSLTPSQHKYLIESVIKFRRQIPADIVAVALRLQKEKEKCQSGQQ